MNRTSFTEEHTRFYEHEAGAKTPDLARKRGISEAMLYNRKGRPGGIGPLPPA